MADAFDRTSAAFFHALDHYVKSAPGAADKAMRRQMRMLIQRIMAWTPPHPGRGGNTERAYATGEAAIIRDLRRIILPLQMEDYLGFRRHFGEKAGELKLKSGRFYDVAITNLASTLRQIHEPARNRRGIVPRSERLKAITSVQGYENYKRQVLRKLGTAKSGWVPAFAALGGRSPAWIARHGMKNGSFRGGVTKRGVSLRAENFAKSIASLQPNIVSRSLAAQEKAMIREIEKMLADEKFKARLGRDIAAS